MPATSAIIEVCPPDREHQATILNLRTLFRYDLLPFIDDGEGSRLNRFGVIGDDAATAHEQSMIGEEIWWTKPGILLPMLIRVGGEPAGFAGVTRPPHAHPSVDYRMEDFFIVNKFRRVGVGRNVVGEIFKRYPGRWEVGWVPRNKPAESFWRTVTQPWHPEDWPVLRAPGTPPLSGLRFTVNPS